MIKKKSKFEDLFKTQIETLKNRGCPEHILSKVERKKDLVIANAMEMDFERGRIPFLPVIHFGDRYTSRINIKDQIKMVRVGDAVGYTELDPSFVADIVKDFNDKEPYFIFNVEDGSVTWGKSNKDAEKIIKKQGRRGLTVAEAIALCIHTDVLSEHCVDAIGSRYGGVRVPDLRFLDGKIELSYRNFGAWDERWGIPSCDKVKKSWFSW